MHRNNEGYADPTAGKAIEKTYNSEKNTAATSLITMIKQIVSFAGFEVVGRIILKDKETGKEYR